MLALKAFVQESVQDLDAQQLQLLSETLRIDLRGCDDRHDIERIVTGLICLDQDTSLGVFLSWLRASDCQNGVLAAKKPFHNTFVPTIAPHEHSKTKRRPQEPSISCTLANQQPSAAPEGQVKDRHLDEEIDLRLAELQDLERDFKAAERLAHTGVPTFEKMKQFLMRLTLLRAKEEETRRFFIKQNALLKKQHGEMRDETLHTRSQLDFFVEGFTNLRHRHDALLEKSTRMHAESEMAQQIFLSMSADESHFAAIMAHTLNVQVAKNSAQQEKLDAAEARIWELEEKQKELLAQISQLKQARGDAKKDASCYKRQLRKCKQKLAHMESENGDCGFFRDQTINLRRSFANLLAYLRESVMRDTKSPKQVLSKEALKIIHQALSATASPPAKVAASQKNEQKQNPLATTDAATAMASISESSSSELYPESISSQPERGLVPRVVKKTTKAKMDLDEAMRGILLLGGGEGESEKCAVLLSSKLKYVPIDVRGMLLRFEEAERQHRSRQALELAQVTEEGTSGPVAAAGIPLANSDIGDTERPLQIDFYQREVKQYIDEQMRARGARGFVLFNWEFTTHDANRLIGMGFPVDSIIDMQTPAPLSPQKLSASGNTTVALSPTSKQPASSSRARATPSSSPVKPNPTSSRTPRAASRNATPATSGSIVAAKSPSKPTPISSNSSPSRASSRQAPPKTPEPKKRPVETPSKQSQQKAPPTSTGKKTTATPAATLKSAAPSPEKKISKIDRKAQFKGLLHVLHQIAPASFPEERVQCILNVLEEQKEQKAAPIVQWDEVTQRTNEMLAMFAEDVHMMIHVEQENRKPKKPGDLAPLSSSSTGSGGSNKPSNSPSKATAASSVSNTARSKAKSPAKPTPTARGSGAVAAATSRRATSTVTTHTTGASFPTSAVSPKHLPEQRSPDRSKRASVATSSPSVSPGKLKNK